MEHEELRNRLELLVAELAALMTNTSATSCANSGDVCGIVIERLADEVLTWILEVRMRTDCLLNV
jgi:hypothetical protein